MDRAGAVAHGLRAHPAPSPAGAEEREGLWGTAGALPPPLGDTVTAPPAALQPHLPAFTSPAPRSWPCARWGPCDWQTQLAPWEDASACSQPFRALRRLASTGPYQVLQSTLMVWPGEYNSLLCTHGHASSFTQPPRPSSISPSGHTQPLMHSVWYCGVARGQGSGIRCGALDGQAGPALGCPLFWHCRHPLWALATPDP